MTFDLVLTVSALITAIGVIVGGIIAVYRIAQKIQKSIGLDSEGRTIAERLEKVEHQLWENGGTSLADRVNVIELHVVKTTAELEFIKNIIIGSKIEVQLPVKKTRVKK